MGSSSVNSVIVEGRMVYQDREFAFDVEPIYQQASKVASRLWQRMDALA
nr:chlorohydrolase [Aeromonas hydrophila]